MSELSKAGRETILSSVIKVVETKHFDPQFNRERWRSEVKHHRDGIVEAASQRDFETGVSELVRAFGTPESGFFHESSRKGVPKGLAARFQYCQPNECAPALTPPSEAGDVMISHPANGVGWLKVTKFPGTIGIDIANEIDHAVRELGDCERLIIDLRGNAGGGLAFLRIMSYLTPERVPVGYSVTRARAATNYSKESLAVFDRIPSRKTGLIWIVLKFGFRDDSVTVVTEGFGPMPFHGKVAILVDESTTGAGERIAAFAQERGLAPVVGSRTAGKLICCSLYKVGQGYFVRIPARAWYTWHGELLESKGVTPDCAVTPSPVSDSDLQMQRAIDIVRGL